jgi:hypothetical protein
MTIAGIAMLLLVLTGCKLADIRTDEMAEQTDEERGKTLLQQMASHHQSHLWDSINTYSLHITDEFYGFAGKIANPFPKNKGEFEMDVIPASFSSRGTFTDEKWKGTVWGIQSWKTFGGNEDQVEFHKKNDKTIEFWLPTYQYLLELPNRITEGSVIRYAGSKSFNNRNYELVFVSWKTDAPQKDIDQYLLWIDASGELAFVQYTVRDQGKIINATLEYASYHNVDGLLIPKEMNVRFFDKKEGKMLHSVITKDVRMNAVKREDILLDSTAGTEGKL